MLSKFKKFQCFHCLLLESLVLSAAPLPEFRAAAASCVLKCGQCRAERLLFHSPYISIYHLKGIITLVSVFNEYQILLNSGADCLQ